MTADADALVIGAGPAGAATAILLERAGWHVVLVEQSAYPRQKVCGECLTAGSLELLDELGVGSECRDLAGPELRQVGWMGQSANLVADLPPCRKGPYEYGRALGRDVLDALLVEHARKLGVTVIQPAKVRTVGGAPGDFECAIEDTGVGSSSSCRVPVVIDAHGSWERGPNESAEAAMRVPRRGSDLFGFKTSFLGAALPGGLLPVLAFPGGYGGLVVAGGERLTLAGCIRRDTLQAWRARMPGALAGIAFEAYLNHSCRGLRGILDGARRLTAWTSVGPLRPGTRIGESGGVFRVGNAAGESHPLIGEGISMALQSAFLLTSRLVRESTTGIDAARLKKVQRDYHAAWRDAFTPRLRVAAAYAHIAMRPALSRPAAAVLRRWPPLLTATARLAGKARSPISAP